MSMLPAMSLGLSAASTAMKVQSAKRQASVARQVGEYNAALDENQAKQLEVDTNFNIAQQREQGKAYLSKQAAAYASSGVLLTGSPLAAMATTAGRLEMNIQNEYIASQRKVSQLYAAAQEARVTGYNQAAAYQSAGIGSLIEGTANFANMLYKDIDTGVFNFGGSKATTPKPSGG